MGNNQVPNWIGDDIVNFFKDAFKDKTTEESYARIFPLIRNARNEQELFNLSDLIYKQSGEGTLSPEITREGLMAIIEGLKGIIEIKNERVSEVNSTIKMMADKIGANIPDEKLGENDKGNA